MGFWEQRSTQPSLNLPLVSRGDRVYRRRICKHYLWLSIDSELLDPSTLICKRAWHMKLMVGGCSPSWGGNLQLLEVHTLPHCCKVLLGQGFSILDIHGHVTYAIFAHLFLLLPTESLVKRHLQIQFQAHLAVHHKAGLHNA